MPNPFRKIVYLIVILCSVLNFAFAHSPLTSSDVYKDVITDLIAHVKGEIVLTDADFVNNNDLLVQNMSVLSSDMESVTNSFNLLELFEENYGALFTSQNTRNGFNRQYTSDGLNLHRNIILIHQGLIDYAYTEQWVQLEQSLFDGKYFKTSQYFPGYVDAPADEEVVENTKIKCSYMLAEGSQPWANIGNSNTVRPTGCYLAPGSIAEITVPEALIGKGIKIRVGAHFWDLESKSRYKRLDRVSITYDINETTTKIAHPLGGGIYIEIPLGIDEGILDIALKNVVRSPFFSKKTFHETSLADWQEVERKHAAPWADFETDKFMMQVPTSWIYEFEDPKTLLEAWDNSMDAVSDLLGRPRITDRHKNYLQFDVVIRGSAYHPGYPMSNTPYDPNASTDGLPNHNILRGPQYNQDIHFHELGHEVAITKFAGETEALVNFLYVPVLNKNFGFSLDEAFQKSFGPSYNLTSTKDNTVRTRLVAETFEKVERRNTCNCAKNEVRYQHRGYAHYVDIVDLYGWEALEKFWKSESDAAAMSNPYPVNNQPQDDRILRMSKAAGVDLRPLFHFWGIIPDDQNALAQQMADNNLALPMKIKYKLHQYRSLIPSDYNEFVTLGNDLYPNFLNYSGSEFNYGSGWYKVTAENYDETKAAQIEKALSEIIIYYYGTDCLELEEFHDAEFSFPAEYCKSNLLNTLPSTTANDIMGSWNEGIIDASVAGQIEYTFVPNLDECTLDTSIMIEIYETTADIVGEVNICHGTNTLLHADASYDSYAWFLDGQLLSESDSVVVSQAGILSLTAIDSNQCISEKDTLISQYEPIIITADVTNPLCFGDYGSAIFASSGGSGEGYVYSMDGEAILAGTYNVLVTDTAGCMETFDFEVVKPDSIVIEWIDNEVMVSGGSEPYTITVDTTDNVQTVSIVDNNGCQAMEAFILSSADDTFFDGLSIYPNPASISLYVDFKDKNTKMKSLSLVAIDGKLLQEYKEDKSQLDVSHIENGVYILQILFENGLKVNKKVSILK